MRILERRGKTVKRVFDVILSALLLIILLPVMAFCAVGVYLSLGSPVLFRQIRVGEGEKEFVMLKFRSMREGCGDGWTTGVDKRKTRFGNFLRRTSLDELPQLVNVLRGEMSLVGPRPELVRFVKKFKGEIKDYSVRHLVKPGITGAAQIKGLRGNTSLTERVSEDISYIEGWSVWLDIKILFLTPFRMLNRSEKYTGEINE
jgi:lipopolysaccharide/colanic/teichoic acid biosynthesis glycosyltransferase